MCGICGIYDLNPDGRVNEQEVQSMSIPIRHRGPDDEGVYTYRNLGLGFRRLSIIDLHNGHQPMCNEDERVWIVFNGEVYNFPELRQMLLKRGHVFKTRTDTETIIHLYEEFGPDCVQKLRGMFAFAIWDQSKRTLFCARDRFGIKPFFYSMKNGRFLFASEIKSILQSSQKGDIDHEVLDYYLTYGYTPPTQTIYQDIEKLPPGHTLTITADGTLKIDRYWHIHFDPQPQISEAEWIERLQDKLEEAVRIRLVSDVPLGAFLSGGLDSGSVVAMMARITDQPVKTFSIGFAEKEFNELPLARLVAEQYGTDHYEHIVEPQSIDILPQLVEMYDEPFADASAIPTYFVCKFARQEVTVALSGDGGDELFAGYDHYQKLLGIHRFHKRTGGILTGAARLLHKLIPTRVKGHGLTYYLSQPPQNFPAYYGKYQQTERILLWKRSMIPELQNPAELIKQEIWETSKGSDFLSRLQGIDMHTWLTDDILTKVDRASMHHSLEVRVPLLDHEFAELTFQIPSSLKLKHKQGKFLFRQAIRPYLPPALFQQPKRGFGVPLKYWFKGDLQSYLHDQLLSTDNPLYHYLNHDRVEKLIEDHRKGMRDLNMKIWSLVFLSAWLDQQKTSEDIIPKAYARF